MGVMGGLGEGEVLGCRWEKESRSEGGGGEGGVGGCG